MTSRLFFLFMPVDVQLELFWILDMVSATLTPPMTDMLSTCTWYQLAWPLPSRYPPNLHIPSYSSYHPSCSLHSLPVAYSTIIPIASPLNIHETHLSHCISSTYSTNPLSYPLLSTSPDHITSPHSYHINLHTSFNSCLHLTIL